MTSTPDNIRTPAEIRERREMFTPHPDILAGAATAMPRLVTRPDPTPEPVEPTDLDSERVQ